MGVAEIADRLDNRFQLLRGGRTHLRGTRRWPLMDWAHDALSGRAAAAAADVFAGGWTLRPPRDGAGAVSPRSVLDLLTQLASKSLIVARRARPLRVTTC